MLRKRQVLTTVSIVLVSFLIGTLFNMNYVVTGGKDKGRDKEELWEAIIELQNKVDSLNTSLIELEERLSALEPPEPVLVGYWQFDEGTGTTAYDSSEYGNNGTLFGGCSWVDGKYGKALHFDGIDDYVGVPHSTSLDFQGVQPFTLSAWIKPDIPQQGKGCCIIDKFSNYGLLSDHPQSKFRSVLIRSGGIWYSAGHVSITAEVWHHYVGVYDPPYLIVYLDGEEIARNNVGSLILDSNTGNAGIGASQLLESWFQGIIDEARIYNGALSGEEIEALYQP